MNESFLHYLWQYQYFAKTELQTTAGEPITVIKPGIYNTDSGADFSNAAISLDSILWNGTVEIHIKSSDWHRHSHQHDRAYENVILHVVWEEDKPIYRLDGTRIPTVELKARVDQSLLNSYKKLVNTSASIPCAELFSTVSEITKISMIERSTVQRMQRKSSEVAELLNQNKGDWEETTYQWLAMNFGLKINKEPFLQLAKNLPYKIVQKHRDHLVQVEALLFGQAGMLVTKTKDAYITHLFQEYQFLSTKFSLQPDALHYTQWKFLRLRPANFPTLRIAQFASFLAKSKSIFSRIIEASDKKELDVIFDFVTSAYWQEHYHFGKKAKSSVKDFGETTRQLLIINAVVPLWVAYGKIHDDDRFIERGISVLQQLKGEKNKITNLWKGLGLTCNSAFDAQGMIELYQNFCEKRNCLTCSIGTSIIKP